MNRRVTGLKRRSGPFAPLSVGARAPDFVLPQVALHELNSDSLRLRHVGRHALVLVFYPMDWEPVSREQLSLYEAYSDSFGRLGARLLGISCDHVYSHTAFAHDVQLHFPLLSDFQPRGQVSRQYGVFREAQGVSARALFILDHRRVIIFGNVYPDELNPGVDELLTALESLAGGNDPTHER